MKIGIVGCGGRMGRMLIETVLSTSGATLAGGTEQPGNALIGTDLGALAGVEPNGLCVGNDLRSMFEAADVVIDFTLPVATVAHAEMAGETRTALVVGTTGLAVEHFAALDAAAKIAPIVHAGNMSIGVNMLLGLIEQVSATLGEEYDIEIMEMHHRHKVDAPSGTALMLGEAAAAGRGVDLNAVSQRTRDGHTGPRKAGDIGFATLRGGDVVGEHSVVFAGEGERIEITHKASSRKLFANGAVRAALWCDGRAPGRYSMKDVLGFS